MLYRLILIVTFWLVPTVGLCATTTSQSSITKDDITWTLNSSYQVGQFVTGDYYVVAPSGLQVTAITASGSEPIGGSMKNPEPSSVQGYVTPTVYGMSYDASKNVGTSLPISLAAGDKLVSTTKYQYYGVSNPDGVLCYTGVGQAAVLTVVSSAPDDGSFRPGLSDGDNNIYHSDDIDYSLLKNLTPVGSPPSVSSVADSVARIWLDHYRGWSGRAIHPHYNMQDYGARLATDISIAALMVNCNYTLAQKEPIVIGLIQMGLDFYSNIEGILYFYQHQPSHIQGRKFPVMFAGNMLDIAEIKSIWPKTGAYLHTTWGTYPGNSRRFAEDTGCDYVRQEDIDATESYSDRYDPEKNYTTAMIGMPEWFHYGTPERKQNTSSWNLDQYRTSTIDQLEGVAIALYAMGWTEQWNHPAFFDYLDRYVAIASGDPDPFGYEVYGEDLKQVRGYGGGTWPVAMWNQYRDTAATPTCATHWSECANQTECELYWYYYDSECNQYPEGYPPPTLSNRYPTSERPSGTTSVNMTVDTDENATVKYGTISGTAYASIANTMTTTGGTSHSVTLSGLTDDSSTTYYLRSTDADGNVNEDDYIITVSVAASTTAECDADNFWLCAQEGETVCGDTGLFFWPAEDNIPATCRTVADTSVGVGNNLLANGFFSDWTGDAPDDWNVTDVGHEGDPSNGYIADGGDFLHAHNDGLGWPPIGVNHLIGTVGNSYELVFDTWGDQAELYTFLGDSEYFDTPGTYIRIITADEAINLFYLQAHHNSVKDTYFDNVVLRALEATAHHGHVNRGFSVTGFSFQ